MSSRQDILRQAFKYQDILESYAYVLLNDWNLSKDAVQEAFIHASEKWEDLDETRLLAWLKTVTKRRSIDLIRSRHRIVHRTDLQDLVDSHFQKHLNDDIQEKNRLYRKYLQECISRLRPDALSIIMDFYDQHKSTDEIARGIKRSPNSVRILLHRIRHKLRKCIDLASSSDKLYE